MTDMRSKGIFILLPYNSLRHLKPLRISPLGYVPQCERWPRIINDYTFSSVNPSTVKMAPQEAMQWGRTLHQVLWYAFTADRRHRPVLLSKTDLSDGFYQLHLTPTGALKLAVPFNHQGRRLLAIPTRLPMGWTKSPPVFSAVTETIANLVNERLEQAGSMPPPHPFETLASTPVPLQDPVASDQFPLKEAGPIRPPLAYVNVYVDDVIKLTQGFHNAMRVHRHTYHAIDEVFRRNDELNRNRKEPISQKKLQKGNDSWSTQKVILGWVVDTATQTIHLPKHCQEKLLTLLHTMVSRKRVSITEWHKLLGELRSMSLALPGSSGCFSLLQTLLKPDKKRLKITESVQHQLLDFLWLAESVLDRPTHLAEIVPTPLSYLGTVDAAKEGMGGVWFPPQKPKPLEIQYPRKHQLQGPILWRARFPKQVQDLLVSQVNPRGSITNSDLELAGAVAHDDVLATSAPRIAHTSTCSFSDNTSAVSWKTKGSMTTNGPAAYLLQMSALHKRHHRYQSLLSYLPGPLNLMADDCSRLWHLTDNQLPTYFISCYPQSTSWTMRHLRPEMHSALTSALLRTRSQLELYLQGTKKDSKLGASGCRFVSPLMLTPISCRWPTLSSFCRPSACDGETVASLQATSPIELDWWRTQYGLSARGFRISPSHLPNRARLVEDAIRLVSQRLPLMGAKDPWLDHASKQDFRLTRMFAAWKKQDDPPKRVEPVPMQILLRAEELIGLHERDRATMDCIWMAFYYLLRPGEYANATGDAKHPLSMKDVQFKIGALHFSDITTCTLAQLHAATYCSLTFTTQKNGVKGKVMAHAANGQPHACPIRAVLRRILHLHTHRAPQTNPLHVFYDSSGAQ